MTKHQAPEVTSGLRECPFCGCIPEIVDRDNIFVFRCPEQSPCFGSGMATYGMIERRDDAITAWNTRATQPLSLTVDEGLVIARLRELLAKATPLPWVRANLANVTIKFTQVAPNVTSEQQAYRPEDTVLCTEVVNALPALLDRLQSLSLPKDAANV